jgi:hypothetical protein
MPALDHERTSDPVTSIAKHRHGVATDTQPDSTFYDWAADDWRTPGTGDIAAAELAARQSKTSSDIGAAGSMPAAGPGW